uniref:Uncharacterized protein n=1 Tax=Arundo donax TaxID=35708 RepID=A0A0A9F7S3_ARUDO
MVRCQRRWTKDRILKVLWISQSSDEICSVARIIWSLYSR